MSPRDVDSLSLAPARRGPHAPRARCAVGLRQGGGFTLVEILIAIAIIAVLAVLALVATRAAIDSARRSTAQATMRMIMVGIEEYTRFWPAPKFPAGRPGAAPGTPRATAGFPEWDCYYLWPGQNFRTLQYRTDPRVVDDPDDQTRFEANDCLSYGLLAQVGGGPYLKNPPDEAVFVTTTDFNTLHSLSGTAGRNVPVRRFVDPWGTAYRYQWMAGTTPITEANEVSQANQGNITDGCRLISAGPDGFFGDANGSTQEKQRAKDNLTLTGP
mgnify:CR=1 FL=1